MDRHDIPLCPISRTAVFLGSKWTAQIMREMLRHKRRRFQDLQDALVGIAPNTLSHRLKLLEQSAILEREFYENNPPRAEYVLTEKGAAMGKILAAMHEWGEKYE
ncbi:helix-turn-helix transcriptional regulator [Erythrobacter sp. SCSIO 43205]|uniref:winged helix-turn-helix transcriptional regulator n=1 Tax=Erythrobacter sp. SCSIO 43205 TaxID=2779361 RepID=UPI001CA7FD2E|nr:helix-turn-helix domain-containing protein [Erythrobacter sp. SCSIO 43205]UAB78812.1 helix-turn-helix transcriptional regulator [Erythrobacter sp. SCSIO 43205]